MFHSLRARLIASYAAIICLCLFLAGSAFAYLLAEYQSQAKLDQLGRLAFSISYQVRLLEGFGADQGKISAFLKDQAEETEVRILLAERNGRILSDTDGGMVGQEVILPREPTAGRRPFTWQVYQTRNEGLMFVLSVPRLGPLNDPVLARPSGYAVILAVPESDVSAAWRELLPVFLAAGGVSLVVSIIVAIFISRTISRPLARITDASEQMARGRYDQFIPVTGRDEIGRLATAFNGMSHQVATSYQTLRDFLANVSHELKTPLTSIQGFSQAMVDGSLRTPEDYRVAGDIVNQEANRMRRLVEDLLFLSKIESGQIGRRDEMVNLEQLLREAAERIDWQVEHSGQRLDLRIARLPLVRGDPHWLGQVFGNLLDNAHKHTPAGATITLGAQPAERFGRVGLWVYIHNAGSFIPSEDLPRIFERFYQVDKSRARAVEGSGLGLAIVREIVSSHGGDVSARSDPTTGTTFDVWLPAVGPPVETSRPIESRV